MDHAKAAQREAPTRNEALPRRQAAARAEMQRAELERADMQRAESAAAEPTIGEFAAAELRNPASTSAALPRAVPPAAAPSADGEFRSTLGGVDSDARERDRSASAAWRPWLAGGSSREVLARIVHEDPLGVREHVARALREGAYLLDGDRVLLRCFALVARHAVRYRGRPDIAEWLALLAREAIAAILREDSEAERRPIVPGREPGREHGAAFIVLSKPLGLDCEALGRACLAFNRLAQSDRTAFFALVLAGKSLDDLARSTGESATEIARRARRALDTLLAGTAVPTAVKAEVATPAQKSSKSAAGRAHSNAERVGEKGLGTP